MHIEGALPADLLFTLASHNGIKLPQDDAAFASPSSLRERYTQFANLDDFLHYYYIGMNVLVTASDFEALAWNYFHDHAAIDGVAHAEIFFDPQAHMARGISYETVLTGLERARFRAQKELGISSELMYALEPLTVSKR